MKTECFLLPVTASVEKEGSQANSGRWMQWKYAAAEGPGDAISTGDVFWRVMSKLKELYAKDGGTFPSRFWRRTPTSWTARAATIPSGWRSTSTATSSRT